MWKYNSVRSENVPARHAPGSGGGAEPVVSGEAVQAAAEPHLIIPALLLSWLSVLSSRRSFHTRHQERLAPVENDEHGIIRRAGYHKTTMKRPVSAGFAPFRFNRPP